MSTPTVDNAASADGTNKVEPAEADHDDATKETDPLVAPQGLELLVPGSSYVIVRGAMTESDVDKLRAVIPTALDEYYEALAAEAKRNETPADGAAGETASETAATAEGDN